MYIHLNFAILRSRLKAMKTIKKETFFLSFFLWSWVDNWQDYSEACLLCNVFAPMKYENCSLWSVAASQSSDFGNCNGYRLQWQLWMLLLHSSNSHSWSHYFRNESIILIWSISMLWLGCFVNVWFRGGLSHSRTME